MKTHRRNGFCVKLKNRRVFSGRCADGGVFLSFHRMIEEGRQSLPAQVAFTRKGKRTVVQTYLELTDEAALAAIQALSSALQMKNDPKYSLAK
jgi:hypothetical protein